MKNSYFIFVSDKMCYPLYVAFSGYLSIEMLRERDVLWTVIRRLSYLNYDDFIIIEQCTSKEYKDGLIKIDFTYKKNSCN